jgi:hypothetical protein
MCHQRLELPYLAASLLRSSSYAQPFVPHARADKGRLDLADSEHFRPALPPQTHLTPAARQRALAAERAGKSLGASAVLSADHDGTPGATIAWKESAICRGSWAYGSAGLPSERKRLTFSTKSRRANSALVNRYRFHIRRGS